MLTDADIVSALRTSTEYRHVGPVHENPLDYRIAEVRVRPGIADFAVTQRDGLQARIVITLPSSAVPQHWNYASPRDAADWVGQLLIWIDEEVFTGGLGPTRAREIHSGKSYVLVEHYGWRRADPKEHARLSARTR